MGHAYNCSLYRRWTIQDETAGSFEYVPDEQAERAVAAWERITEAARWYGSGDKRRGIALIRQEEQSMPMSALRVWLNRVLKILEKEAADAVQTTNS